MRRPVVFTPLAQEEFLDAARWYEQQARRGHQFRQSVRDLLERLRRFPEMYGLVGGDIRRANVLGFSYDLYYRCKPAVVEVIAVLHQSRDPGVWQSRF